MALAIASEGRPTCSIYQVQGVRGSIVGPVSFPFTVPFGTADAGAQSVAA